MKTTKNLSQNSRSPRLEGRTSRTRSKSDTPLIETFRELVRNFVINEDALSFSRITVRVFTLLLEAGSKEERRLGEGDRGGQSPKTARSAIQKDFFSMARQPYMGLGLLVSSRLHDHTQTHHTR
jgi:hypothetical protein